MIICICICIWWSLDDWAVPTDVSTLLMYAPKINKRIITHVKMNETPNSNTHHFIRHFPSNFYYQGQTKGIIITVPVKTRTDHYPPAQCKSNKQLRQVYQDWISSLHNTQQHLCFNVFSVNSQRIDALLLCMLPNDCTLMLPNDCTLYYFSQFPLHLTKNWRLWKVLDLPCWTFSSFLRRVFWVLIWTVLSNQLVRC